VLVDSDVLQAADAQLLEELLSTDYLELVVVAVVRPRARVSKGSRRARALINLYRWMDRPMSGGGAAEATRPLTSCTAGRTHETIVAEGAGEKLAAALTARSLDVVICLSPFEGMRNCAAARGLECGGPTHAFRGQRRRVRQQPVCDGRGR